MKKLFLLFTLCISGWTLCSAQIYAAADSVAWDDPDGAIEVVEMPVSEAMDYYESIGRTHPVFDAWESEDYEALVDSANVVLAKFPDDLDSYRARSCAYYMLQDYPRSLSDALEVYCQLQYDDLIQGIIHNIVMMDPAMARQQISPYTESYIASPEPEEGYCVRLYLNQLARCELNLGQLREAYKAARLAVDIPNDDYESEVLLGSIYMRSGNPGEAEKLFRSAVKDLDSADPAMVVNYCLALRNSGRSKEALRIYDRMVSKNADDDDTRMYFLYNKAILLAATGQYDKAVKIYDELIDYYVPEMDETLVGLPGEILEIMLRKGIVDIVRGRKEKGEAEIRDVLSFCTDEDNPKGIEITAYAWLGDRENTMKWRDIYGSDYTDPSAALAILGDYKEALELIRKEFETYGTTPMQLEYDINYLALRQTPEYKALAASFKPLKF